MGEILGRLELNVPILGPVIGEGFADALVAAQEGSEAAFTQLWRDANPALLRYLRVIAADTSDDVAAETWVLVTTARRRAIDAVRHGARRPQAPLDDLPPSRHPVTPDPADLAMERVSTQSAIALLTRLPRLQAEVILLRVVAGLDTESVARLVERSPGAVRVAAHRGLRTLAQILAAEGVTL